MDDEKSQRVEVLDGTNYMIWKWQLSAVLSAKGLTETIEGDEEVIGGREKVDAANTANKERLAFSLIASTLDRSNKLKVLDCKTPREIWLRLESLYENKTGFETQSLLGKLHNFRISNSKQVGESIGEIQSIIAKLTLLNEKVSDNMTMSIILNALPESYKSFISTWRLLRADERSLNRLISEIMSLATSDNDDNKAFVARRVGKKRNFERNREKAVASKQQGRSTSKKNGNCHNCGKPGHWARDCLVKTRDNRSNEGRFQNGGSNENGEHISFMAMTNDHSTKSSWIVDSGSTVHMTAQRNWLVNYKTFYEPKKVRLGDDYSINALGSGDIEIDIGQLRNVYYVPDISENLFSLLAATRNGVEGRFNKDSIIFVMNNKEVTRAFNKNGIYRLDLNVISDGNKAMMASTMTEWHNKLGHVSNETIERMKRCGAVTGLNVSAKPVQRCDDCLLGKCKKNAHPSRTTPKIGKPGLSLHLDTVGPVSPPSLNNAKYFVLCKDEYSAFCMVRFVERKSQIANEVKRLISKAELDTGNKLLKLVTDNGTEFNSNELSHFLREKGVIREFSVPYAHEQNGFIEREIRSTTEAARALLNKSGLAKSLWAEAVNTAVYVRNRVIRGSDNHTPYEKWFGRRPDISNLLTFGQQVVCYMPKEKRTSECSKFGNRGTVQNFVGYTDTFNTYRVYDRIKNIVTLSCDVVPVSKPIETPQESKTKSQVIVIDGKETKQNELVDRSYHLNNSKRDETNSTWFRTEQHSRSYKPIALPYHQLAYDEWSFDVGSSIGDELDKNVSELNELLEQLDEREREQTEQSTSRANTSVEGNINHDRVFSTPIGGQKRSGQQEMSEEQVNSIRNNAPKQLQIAKQPPDVLPTRLRPDPKTTGVTITSDTPIDDSANDPDYEPREHRANLSLIENSNDPINYEEAMSRDDKDKWIEAMNDEMASMSKNNVWELVDRPKGNIVSNKWVFKRKYDQNGNIIKYKARLVARGFSQKYGIDYHETYSPVVNMVFIRLLIAYAAVERLKIATFDVKTAFLYGDLDETIYMDQPKGFEKDKNKVCLLKRSLYGLKQAPRQWGLKFKNFLIEMKLTNSIVDECVFYCKEPLLIIGIYVDDGIVFARESSSIDYVLKKLRQEFDIHTMDTNVYLGFEIHRGTNDDITLHQKSYIKKILNQYKMLNGPTVDTPTLVGQPTSRSDDENPVSKTTPYREAVGSLMYAAVTTRIDIMHAVGKVSREVANPTELAWKAVKRIFRYLREKEKFGLTYSRDKHRGLVVYCDADFAGDKGTSRSTTGAVFLFGGAPIHWKSQRQALITLSSTEAEFVSMCSTVKLTVWIRKFGIELGIIDETPTRILCDNESAIRISMNEKCSNRTRHMNVQAAYPREMIEKGEITIEHVKSDQQLADMLTKPMSTTSFVRNRNKLMTTAASWLTAMLAVVSLIPMKTGSTEMLEVNPLLWKPIETYIDGGIANYEVRLKVQNPCMMIDYIRIQNSQNETTTATPNGNTTSIENENLEEVLYHNLVAECTQSFDTMWKFPMSEIVKIKPQKETNRIDKRDLWDVGSGVVNGICVSNLLNSIWEKINPTSERNKVKSLETELYAKSEILSHLTTKINYTMEIQDRMLNMINRLNHRMSGNERKIQIMANVLPHFTWKTTYVITKLMAVNHDLQVIAEKYKHNGMAVEEWRRLLNMTELEGVNDEDATLHSVKQDNRDKQYVINFSFKIKDKSSKVYTAIGINHWVNITSKPVFVKYAGPQFLMHNLTNNCVKGIVTISSKFITEECDEPNNEDPSLNKWNPYRESENITTIGPTVKRTPDTTYVYCYPFNITIPPKTHRCPPYPFKLKSTTGFETGRHYYKTIGYNKSLTMWTLKSEVIDSISKQYYQSSYDQSMTLKLIDEINELKAKMKVSSESTFEQTMDYITLYVTNDWHYLGTIAILITLLLVVSYIAYHKKETRIYERVTRPPMKFRSIPEIISLVPTRGQTVVKQVDYPQPPPMLEFSSTGAC